MKKNITLYLLIGSMFWSIPLIGQEVKYNIHFSQMFEQKKDASPQLQEASVGLETFINAYSDSLFFNHDEISPQLKTMYNQLFFPPIKDSRYSHFYIVEGKVISSELCEFKIVTRQTIPELNSDEILSINDVFVNKNKVDIGYRQRLEHYEKINVGSITYYVKDKRFFDWEEAQKAIFFCDKIKQLFNIKQLPELHYILSKNEENPLMFFGFEYTWSPLVCYIKAENLLLSDNIGENYRHELVHYVLQEYNLNEAVSEGLAVYMGGSGGKSFEEFVKETIEKHGNPSVEQIIEVLTVDKASFNHFKYLYCLNAVCVEILYLEKGIAGLQSLLETKYQTLNMIQILEDVLDRPQQEIIAAIIKNL